MFTQLEMKLLSYKHLTVSFLFLLLMQSTIAENTVAESFLATGIGHFEKGNYDSAKINFNSAVQEAKKESDSKLLSNAYNNLGNCYANTGNAPEALKNYQLAVSIAEKIGDNARIAKTLKNIGTVYSEQKDFKMANQFYDRSLAIAQKIQDSSIIADIYNNQGVIFEQQNNYARAADVYTKALAIYRSEHNDDRISMGLNNLGIVYKYLGNYPQSLANYDEALALSKKLGDRFMIAATINNMGSVYALKGEYARALILYMEALDTAKKIKATEIIIENYDGIAYCYEMLQRYPEALKYRKLYEQERNEFINTQRSGQLADMQTKYETEKKENEIQLLKQKERISALEIAEQKLQIQKRNYLLYGGLLLLIGLSSGLYFWYGNQKLKNKLEQERAIKQTEENERMRIAKDIHDDLGSGLSKINFLSEVITQKATQFPEIKSGSEAVSETARKMVENMRDLIWALNPENTTLANLIARIREYSSEYLEDFPIELRASYPEQIAQMPISKESHRGVFMVVKESLNNIVKHAYAAEIKIVAKITPDNFSISIEDNGVGFDTTYYAAGNGLRNMKNRIQAAGGNMNIQSEIKRGTRISITVPLAAA